MNRAGTICGILVAVLCAISSRSDWSSGTIVDGDPFSYTPSVSHYLNERDPIFTNWLADASALTLKLGGSTNVLTDDGTNLLRNGILIAGSGGSGSGFPATNDMNAAGYDLTNAGTVQASAFQGGTFNGTTIAGTTFSGQNMTLSGTLVVNTISNQHTTYQSATVNLGTNYITNTYTTANYTTNYVYANIVTTEINYVTNYSEQQTIVNVGGYMDVSYADWVALPHMTDSNDIVTAIGSWDFTGATVSGIVAGSTVTNIGFGLTGDGDETALAVDTSIVATGTPLYAYTETDPVFVSWLGNNFTGAVEALVETIAVTGAVTSINGGDGAVTLTIDGAGVTTNSATSWTIAAGGSGGTPNKLITSWSIYGPQATNISPVTTSGVQYINFAVNSGGGYVDTKRFVFSNAMYKAAYITAYAYGATGTCSLVVRINGDEPVTNTLNLSSSVSTNAFALTNSLLPLSENTIDWGIIGGTATNDIRVRSFTIKVDAE